MSLIENDIPRQRLTDKARVILAALVHGVDGKLAERHRLEPGRALSPNAVADLYNVRRAYVRNLLSEPLFKAEMAQAMAAKRLAYMPEALDRVATIMRSDNEPVALRASETILGETTKPALTVNVSQTNQFAQIRPGYVIRMPNDVAPPSLPTE